VGQLAYQQASPVGPPVRLPPRLVPLAGREELLAELDARLSGDGSPEPRIVVLYGLGGAGKSSVAVEYAYRHLAEVRLAWQFAAADPAVLAAEFGELAAQLGVRDFLDTRDWVATVHGVLAQYPARWLLVFDNATDTASVAEFLPPAGLGRVLVTSQNPAWQTGQTLEVPVLRPEVAADFLIQRTGDPDRQAAEDLAEELDGLPLALAQAAAYMQATGDKLAEYLESFRQRRADMLARGASIRHGKTVASTWALAFGRLQKDTPEAVALLRLMAFCAPEEIPLRLLLQPRPELSELLGQEVAPLLADQLTAKDAIAALSRYSLVTHAGRGLVSVHRLVQAVTADQMPAELADQWQQAAAALIEAAIPKDSRQPQTWPVFRLLLPHAEKALAPSSSGMERIASYLGNSGSYAAATDLQQRVLGAREEKLGPDDPDTLTARHNLARWTGRAGDAAEARDQDEALLPVIERVLGPEDPDTLAVRADIAHWTRMTRGRARAADQGGEGGEGGEGPATLRGPGRRRARYATLYAGLLPEFEQILGPEHPDTLAVRAGLAWSTGEAGNPVEARDQLAALLPVIERVLGPEHPLTLDARAEIARRPGRGAREAADLYAGVLPEFERILGPEHPDTLAVRAGLAWSTGEAGNPVEARDQFAALLPVVKEVIGPEHPLTLDARAGLARWTGSKRGVGDAAGARDQFADLLPVYERILGPEHPETLRIRHSVARWTGQAGDAAGARDKYKELLSVRERILGPEHPDTRDARKLLAHWTEEADSEAN
jgi:Tetratricopeptide repeat